MALSQQLSFGRCKRQPASGLELGRRHGDNSESNNGTKRLLPTVAVVSVDCRDPVAAVRRGPRTLLGVEPTLDRRRSDDVGQCGDVLSVPLSAVSVIDCKMSDAVGDSIKPARVTLTIQTNKLS